MGLLSGMSGSMESLARSKSRSKSDAGLSVDTTNSTGGGDKDGNPNDSMALDKEEGNILMSLIAQRRCSTAAGLWS